ncbi:uracil-DNA glycosylase [Sulfurimonas sp. HSL1-2]|uniref:uracil-DNA glycosylase n=1 Tax=Thiomicrolovo zhangzhouensis TaxID=3131933 RepID=UPI0031F7670A
MSAAVKIDADIKRFGKRLQESAVGANVTNFYAAKRTNTQRHNLQCYLQQLRALQPEVLLIGEAPGYNGCRLTGIPFSSEALVAEGVLEGALFTARHGYRVASSPYTREQSAGIVWEVLQRHRIAALCWNAFCFHPHEKGNPDSNRKPTGKEIDSAAPFLRRLLSLFPSVTTVVAVGNSAEAALTRLQIPHAKVRHPARGGKPAFTAGMEAVLACR